MKKTLMFIPPEILCFEILTFFSIKELNVLKLVNKRFLKLSEESDLWTVFLERDLGKKSFKVINKMLSQRLSARMKYKYSLELCDYCNANYKEILECFRNGKKDFFDKNKNLEKKIIDVEDLFLFSEKEFYEWLDEIQRVKIQKNVLSAYVFEGKKSFGLYNGLGRITFKDGSTYYGEWKNGRRSGKGKYEWVSQGIVTDSFYGEWKNDVRNGYGVYKFSTGEKYEGDWFEGEKHGKGRYTYKDGSYYDGYWENGKKNGKGIYNYGENILYDGFFKSDAREGYGSFFYKDGSYYEGNFAKSRFCGEGNFVSKFHNIKLSGYFGFIEKKNRSFKGVIKVFESNDDTKNSRNKIFKKDTYKGLWKNGKNVNYPELPCIHIGYYCHLCLQVPIIGDRRYECETCFDFVCCENCKSKHFKDHKFQVYDLTKL